MSYETRHSLQNADDFVLADAADHCRAVLTAYCVESLEAYRVLAAGRELELPQANRELTRAESCYWEH